VSSPSGIVYYGSIKRGLQRIMKGIVLIYYEWMKRELKIRPIYECRCDERLNTKVGESTGLAHNLI
jgi:hypothetical protein